MSITKLAFINFKSSFERYLSLVVSLSFTILIFLNFQNIIYSDVFQVLGSRNKEYIDIIVQSISFVLGCFMLFFIWYAMNVFLKKRKKEIGVYIFMGLTNQRIGKLYILEMIMIGFSALIFGVGFGIITTQLFQMILLALSDIAVEINFKFSIEPILITGAVYLIIYMIFVFKGYINIVRSSIKDMISASKQNEYVRQNLVILFIKTVLGLFILIAGYYMAIKDGGQEVLGNVLIAVVLVVIGVYLLFGGFIPMIFQGLVRNKKFLYKKQRTLWINNVIFRIKKNYNTYAMVCILTLCSVTALATSFAMKNRYDNMIQFRNTYTFQFLSEKSGLRQEMQAFIEQYSKLEYASEISVVNLERSLVKSNDFNKISSFLSYSKVKQLAQEIGLEFSLEEPKDHEVIQTGHMPLLSLITEDANIEITIHGENYKQIRETKVSYLGYLQESLGFYIVNDKEYEKLKPLGEELFIYNYKISDLSKFQETKKAVDSLVKQKKESYLGRVAIDPESSEIDWIKVLYSICIFMFIVFILASGSIMFMKLYNDAFEERERYLILKKMGMEHKVLKKSIVNELRISYILPLIIMAISSYFSVHALGKMMFTNLFSINVITVLIVFVIFFLFYGISIRVYQKNAGVL